MTAGAVVFTTPLQRRLASVVAETLRISIEHVVPDESFAALGMDSLAAVELTAAIEDELGIELSLTAVHECPTLESLCALIEGGESAAPASSRQRMLTDAILPSEIAPNLELSAHARRTCDACSVLVTGATGFVGAFLLRAIASESDAQIYCLVRPSERESRQRLREHLAAYDLWTASLDSRIHIVDGDLAFPRFGLSADAFARVAGDVDAIYHAAADVNWVASYEALRSVNVLGTSEVLRLACTGVPKPVHFLSSVSVCHSTIAPRHVDESLDAVLGIGGLWMGYAQSKCVAESLVRAAGERGLPVTIIRPSLVTGDGVNGCSNPDDLVSRFIAGCIRMRAAPDLDWRMDCVPVDDVATSIVRLARASEGGSATLHVTAVRPRHWRECVLWMRLAGYDIELVPYREWMEILRATSAEQNPLQSLRSFFLQPIASEDHLTLPELFEESRRTQVDDARTRGRLSMLGHSSRSLTTDLLSRYFDDYERHDLVPPAPTRPRRRTDEVDTPATPSLVAVLPELTRSLGQWCRDESIAIESIVLRPLETEESIVSELTSWRGGTSAGLYRAAVEVVGRRVPRRVIKLFVKSKPADGHVIDVAEAIAALASPALGETVARFRDHLGFTRSNAREIALYADGDARLRRNSPHVFATQHDDAVGQWLVVLESVEGGKSLTRLGGESVWPDGAIDVAIAGLAQIHAMGFERRSEMAAASWQAPLRDEDRRREMLPLWSALATHAFEHSQLWEDRRLRRTHERLVDQLSGWARELDVGPSTLIHNDFNPRNTIVRASGASRSLCAFDWELSTMGLPQRDLAELLAFVLPENAPQSAIAWWIERHRQQLERETRVELRRDAWERGFSAVLCDLLVDRLSSYAMVDRIRAQSFLPRVIRGWNNLFHHFPWTA